MQQLKLAINAIINWHMRCWRWRDGFERRQMRIRIVQQPPMASVDGIRLDCFEVGAEYEVGTTIAALFLAEGWAEPLPLDAPRVHTPFDLDDPFDSRTLYPERPANVIERPANVIKDPHSRFREREIAADATRRHRR